MHVIFFLVTNSKFVTTLSPNLGFVATEIGSLSLLFDTFFWKAKYNSNLKKKLNATKDCFDFEHSHG
jgi:hypothetical protein